MNIFQCLTWGKQKLSSNERKNDGINLDIEILLVKSLNNKYDRAWLYAHPEYKLTPAEAARFRRHIARRAKGEPVAYITRHKEFYGLDLAVNKHVLIPRPETEMIVEEAITKINNQSTRNRGEEIKNKKPEIRNFLLIDAGTGSGCIPIAILKKIPVTNSELQVTSYAIDISRKALLMAKKNAKKHGLGSKIKFWRGNLLEPIINNSKFKIQNSKLIITANLPYLSPQMYQKNYQGLRFEPKQALVAGKNGLQLYEELLEQISTLKKMLNCYIVILLEIDPGQSKIIMKLIKKYLPGASMEIKKDLAGRNRVVEVKL
jgi:release factor glutamine methyltransferase